VAPKVVSLASFGSASFVSLGGRLVLRPAVLRTAIASLAGWIIRYCAGAEECRCTEVSPRRRPRAPRPFGAA